MEILVITMYIPYPLDTGGALAQFSFIDYLRKIHSFTLIVFAYNEKDIFNIEALEKLWPDVSIQAAIPYPFKKEVAEHEQEKAGDEDHVTGWIYSEIEEPYLINIAEPKYRAFIETLYATIGNKRFDIIQVEFMEFIDLIYLLPKNCKRIFVHHEIRFARIESFLQANNTSINSYEKYILRHVKSIEANILNQYDAVFTLSVTDKEKLQKELITAPVYVSPFPVLDESFIQIPETFAFNKLVFIGGSSHYPNIDAVTWYKNEIDQPVFKEHGLKLHVVGKWAQKNIKSHKSDSIIFEGFIDDIVAYCNNSVMVVPVRIGSGLRSKILIAMAQGVPVVATSMACEGIPVIDKENVFIADTPAEFTKAIEYLRHNRDELKRILNNAQQLVKNNFSQMVACELRNSHYHKLL
jgi:glycosyltransferase involved in cell wall biosynthesis